MTWRLVEDPCYINHQCQDKYTEGSIYYMGPYGEWKTVIILAPKHLLTGYVNKDCMKCQIFSSEYLFPSNGITVGVNIYCKE